MLRKILVVAGIIFVTFAGSAAAQEVTVVGVGADRNSAIRDAAKIDVDTNPNSALVDRLTMIMQLNDPRISVHAEISDVEDFLVEKLLDAGFNHVTKKADADAQKNSGADYLISCRSTQNSRQAKIPAYGEKIQAAETNFYNAKTNQYNT